MNKPCIECVYYHRPLCLKGFKVNSGYDNTQNCNEGKEKECEVDE